MTTATAVTKYVRIEVLTGGILAHAPDPRIIASANDLIAAIEGSELAPEDTEVPLLLRAEVIAGGLRIRFRDHNLGLRQFLVPSGDAVAAEQLWMTVRDVSARKATTRLRELEDLGFQGDPSEVVEVRLGPLAGEVTREDIRAGSSFIRSMFGALRKVSTSAAERARLEELQRRGAKR